MKPSVNIQSAPEDDGRDEIRTGDLLTSWIDRGIRLPPPACTDHGKVFDCPDKSIHHQKTA